MTDTEEPALGKREARKQDRRDAIVAAARRSFLEEGYAATSMSGLLKTLGGLSPALAGGAMALSSLTVLGNALRLTRWKPEGETAHEHR